MTNLPDYLHKIITLNQWEKSQNKEYIFLLDSDNQFIHFAEKDDIERIKNKFFSDQDKLVVLTVNPQKLVGKLIKEKNPGGSRKYYHLYDGSIPLKSIESIEIK